MAASELEVYLLKEFTVYQSLKATIENLGQNFEIILWKRVHFLIKLQARNMKLY